MTYLEFSSHEKKRIEVNLHVLNNILNLDQNLVDYTYFVLL